MQNQEKTILKVDKLTKTFSLPSHKITVIKGVSFTIESGSTASIIGPSGSGKSTLLALCAGLDRPSSGNIVLNNSDLGKLDENSLAQLRNGSVGFVFQNFQLIPTLTALENVMVPRELQRGQRDCLNPAREILEKVGLSDRLHHYPLQLSGGEQQRVAIARAFVNRPAILFADEPIGNLDKENGEAIEKLLFDLNQQHGTTLILVTHNQDLAKKTSRVIELKGGEVVRDSAS